LSFLSVKYVILKKFFKDYMKRLKKSDLWLYLNYSFTYYDFK